MRIEPITNTNFKGLFTDKSGENNGNWKMEYSPYSWERDNTSKMATKEQIDLFASSLPDNEEIYTEGYKNSSRDILGTESYYINNSTGQMRSTISEVPAMDRENSLKVLVKKLSIFLDMKKDLKAQLAKEFETCYSKVSSHSYKFDTFSDDYDLGGWFGDRKRNENKENMVFHKNKITESADSMHDYGNKYITLDNSIDKVNQTKQDGLKEIKTLEEARKSGQIIDISRRDIERANEPLIEALKNIKATTGKILVLPHASIKLSNFLDKLKARGINTSSPEEVIKYVDTLIKQIIRYI